MVADARKQTKTFLDTYLTNANLLKDDDVTQVVFVVIYAFPDYPLLREFRAISGVAVDLIYAIGDPNSTPLLGHDQIPHGYMEHVPIYTFCIDKTGITGTKLKWKAEAELRRICETQSTGSQRAVERRGDNDKRLGSTILYSSEFVLKYRRLTT